MSFSVNVTWSGDFAANFGAVALAADSGVGDTEESVRVPHAASASAARASITMWACFIDTPPELELKRGRAAQAGRGRRRGQAAPPRLRARPRCVGRDGNPSPPALRL